MKRVHGLVMVFSFFFNNATFLVDKKRFVAVLLDNKEQSRYA